MSEEIISRREAVAAVRSACRQFAMLYFHFAKTLVDAFGVEKAKDLIRQTIFDLALDRSGQLRAKAQKQGLELTQPNFRRVTDLPFIGWDKSLGRNHCPYAETWVKYYDRYPWFRELAPFYCDVIDTTNIENFTRKLSHRLVKNVLKGDKSCERVYFPDEKVATGGYTYGERGK